MTNSTSGIGDNRHDYSDYNVDRAKKTGDQNSNIGSESLQEIQLMVDELEKSLKALQKSFGGDTSEVHSTISNLKDIVNEVKNGKTAPDDAKQEAIMQVQTLSQHFETVIQLNPNNSVVANFKDKLDTFGS